MRSIVIVSVCVDIIIHTLIKPIPSIFIVLLIKVILKYEITCGCAVIRIVLIIAIWVKTFKKIYFKLI